MQNGHNSLAIANMFVQEAQNSQQRLTIMMLVKFIYFAHGWNLGYTDEPLISDKIEAWRFGPVVPKTYYAFRDSGFIIHNKVIDPQTKQPYAADLSEANNDIVIGVYKEYSKMSAWGLSHTTHHESSPWYKYRHQHNATIPNEEIKEYYKGLLAKIKAESKSENL